MEEILHLLVTGALIFPPVGDHQTGTIGIARQGNVKRQQRKKQMIKVALPGRGRASVGQTGHRKSFLSRMEQTFWDLTKVLLTLMPIAGVTGEWRLAILSTKLERKAFMMAN